MYKFKLVLPFSTLSFSTRTVPKYSQFIAPVLPGAYPRSQPEWAQGERTNFFLWSSLHLFGMTGHTSAHIHQGLGPCSTPCRRFTITESLAYLRTDLDPRLLWRPCVNRKSTVYSFKLNLLSTFGNPVIEYFNSELKWNENFHFSDPELSLFTQYSMPVCSI